MSSVHGRKELSRSERVEGLGQSDDEKRSPFQRDRDRVLYSEYFIRLAGVTQVASAADGGVFHNRLIHSLKVAQVGRRLAERLVLDHPELTSDLDPDVVEAASLAHDLGHPPFGHAGERKLCKLADKAGLLDGFEGNAQTFRIISRLSVHGGRSSGLDLTRATLNATLKYPWRRLGPEGTKRWKKYSVYESDIKAFDFARQGSPVDQKCLEAQVMDLADSITYSVHDLEDFRRAGLIPLEKIVRNSEYRKKFFERWTAAEPEDSALRHFRSDDAMRSLQAVLEYCISDTADMGSREDLEVLERFRSAAITKFLGAVSLTGGSEPLLEMSEEADFQCKFLHRLVRDFVIDSPRLATQQYGQARIIEKLVDYFAKAIADRRFERLPSRFRAYAESDFSDEDTAKRIPIDVVASLSEAEAIHIYKRIMGQASGSLLDPMN